MAHSGRVVERAHFVRTASETVKMPHSSESEVVDLAEACGSRDEVIELALRAATHDPRRTVAVAGERPGDQFQLRMPRLAGVDRAAPEPGRHG